MIEEIPITYQDIVQEIVKFTDFSLEETENKLRQEAIATGYNVCQDVEYFGCQPHYYDKNMERLYKEGTGFIFETLVFWTRKERQVWTELAVDRIKAYAKRNQLNLGDLKIIIQGDGTGNDSIYLAKNGLNVNYLDFPGSKTSDFAKKRFEHYNLLESSIKVFDTLENLERHQWDIFISFDVLEHLPEPISTIVEIGSLLKERGIALISEGFAGVMPALPTHLKSNLKHNGGTPFYFMKNNMFLSWYNSTPLFKPMEFVYCSEHKSILFWEFLRLVYNDPQMRTCYWVWTKSQIKHKYLKDFFSKLG